MSSELSTQPGNPGVQHQGAPWLEVSLLPTRSQWEGPRVAAAARSLSPELGDVVVPPSHALHTAHWLERASHFLPPTVTTNTLPPPRPRPLLGARAPVPGEARERTIPLRKLV